MSIDGPALKGFPNHGVRKPRTESMASLIQRAVGNRSATSLRSASASANSKMLITRRSEPGKWFADQEPLTT